MTLQEAGFTAMFNDKPLEQVAGMEIEVGSTYRFEISHPTDAAMRQNAVLEFEIDWSSMVHVYTYDDLNQVVNGTLRVIGDTSIQVTVGVTTTTSSTSAPADEDDQQCTTYSSGPYAFRVVPTNETLTLDDKGTNHACNICGVPDAEASSTLVLHPDYALERPCDEWQQDGVDGRLTPEACKFLFRFPAVAAVCACRHGTSSAASGRGVALHRSVIVLLAVVLAEAAAATWR